MIAGSEDIGATQAAIIFLSSMKQAKPRYEMLVTRDRFFNEGKNYNRRPSGPHGAWKIFLAASCCAACSCLAKLWQRFLY